MLTRLIFYPRLDYSFVKEVPHEFLYAYERTDIERSRPKKIEMPSKSETQQTSTAILQVKSTGIVDSKNKFQPTDPPSHRLFCPKHITQRK